MLNTTMNNFDICHHNAGSRGTGAAQSAAPRAAQRFAGEIVLLLRNTRVVVVILALSLSGCAIGGVVHIGRTVVEVDAADQFDIRGNKAGVIE